jgi:hypothetical protein
MNNSICNVKDHESLGTYDARKLSFSPPAINIGFKESNIPK